MINAILIGVLSAVMLFMSTVQIYDVMERWWYRHEGDSDD